jgi:two-component system NtrC family sensor kinase
MPVADVPGTELDEAMPLTRQVERWMRDMNILTRIGKALVAQLDLDKVCARAVEATIYLTRADHAFLFLKEGIEGASLHLCATRGPHDRHVRFVGLPVEGGLAAQVDGTGKTMLQASGEGDPFLREIAGERLGPVAAVPLRWQKEASGVLVAARSPDEFAFGEADVEWLSGLADYVSIALRNARAFRRTAEQAEARDLADEEAEGWQRELDELVKLLQSASETAVQLADRLSLGDMTAGEASSTD